LSEDYLKFEIHELPPEEPCEFCGSDRDGVMTFWVGNFGEDDYEVLGRACVRCLWKGISQVLNNSSIKTKKVGEEK